jgi:hypothetical protein
MNKNYLLICELFHPNLHGYDMNQSDPNIHGHYIIIHIDDNSDQDSEYYSDIDSDSEDDYFILNEVMIDIYRKKYKYLTESYKKNNLEIIHPTIRNYFNIISAQNYIEPNIGYKVYLSGNECVAILKTFWLRIVQRCWKRVYRTRKEMMKQNNILKLLRLREITPTYHIRASMIHGMFWSG